MPWTVSQTSCYRLWGNNQQQVPVKQVNLFLYPETQAANPSQALQMPTFYSINSFTTEAKAWKTRSTFVMLIQQESDVIRLQICHKSPELLHLRCINKMFITQGSKEASLLSLDYSNRKKNMAPIMREMYEKSLLW